MSVEENIKTVFSAVPDAVRRQGAALFVTTPLYQSKRRHTPVYINRDLFKSIFSCTTEPSFEEMAVLIEKYFSSTIEKENSTGEQVGTAYVDRQADPLDISLSGNLGSGRAYYVGGVFNIKGEKTPLAQSVQKKYSDGLLEMERCVWETLIANALQGSMTTGLSSVLAILDMNELCEVGWRELPVKRGKIIRVDLDGSLDRVTHLFHLQKPLTLKAWHDCADGYGRLEGDKFIERMIHGTWSPGNISPQGHLIDFDTVCAVKGRSPQFSSTRWYQENYFGSEFNGQLRVIRAMTEDPQLNALGLKFEDLKGRMLEAMRRQISARFALLMGFQNSEKIYAGFKADIDTLTDLWIELARKGFKKHEEFSAKNSLSVALHLFDFSAFFRVYPMLKRAGDFSPQDAVALMSENTAWADPYASLDDRTLPAIEQEHLQVIYAGIGAHFVTVEEDAQMLQFAALSFVKKYDGLYEKILAATGADILEVEARAYVVNEDRFYLFPAYTVSYQIAKNEARRNGAQLHQIIETLIRANQRSFAAQKVNPSFAAQNLNRCMESRTPSYIADIRLYQDGYLYTVQDGQGQHQLGFTFWDSRAAAGISALEVENTRLELSSDTNEITMLSRKIDNKTLCENFFREKSFQTETINAIYEHKNARHEHKSKILKNLFGE
jgi:hypothetical protein